MAGTTRRSILLSALAGPVAFAQEQRTSAPPAFADFHGRAIQRPDESTELLPHEREHVIEIEMPEAIKVDAPFDLSFSMPNHPKNGPHHLMWMRIFVDNQMVSYMTFAPKWVQPRAALTLELPAARRIEIIAECNRHGIWGKAVPVVFDLES